MDRASDNSDALSLFGYADTPGGAQDIFSESVVADFDGFSDLLAFGYRFLN